MTQSAHPDLNWGPFERSVFFPDVNDYKIHKCKKKQKMMGEAREDTRPKCEQRKTAATNQHPALRDPSCQHKENHEMGKC